MESTFQFKTPILTKLEYNINKDYDCLEDMELPMDMSVNVKRDPMQSEAIVELSITIGGEDDKCPFNISAVEGARFRWNSSLPTEMVDKLLNENAPSLLLSYLRPVIVQITSASPFDTFNIPFINFRK